MKRVALTEHLQHHGCVLLREGGRHSIYVNPANNHTSAVPRHAEIADVLARKICRDLDIPMP
jgi:predicted RNA binding protein YcfA (HicA-like mRNA interferase family)